MDVSVQRTQAHCLIDALPQDSLEIVVALMRKLTNTDSPRESCLVSDEMSDSQSASLTNIRALAGCFSSNQSKAWKEEKADYLQEKYH